MNVKSAWYSVGAVVLALSVLVVSCSMIEPPAPPLPVATVRLPPAIPHTTEGRADCRLCHATGIAGARQFPASHVNRPSDVCLACHVPIPEFMPTTMPMPTVTSPGTPATAGTAPATPGITPTAGTATTVVSGKDLFSAKCAACHGANRQGTPGLAPALTPESLAALSDSKITDTILNGRPGTAMQAFKGTLSPEEVDALLKFIKSPIP